MKSIKSIGIRKLDDYDDSVIDKVMDPTKILDLKINEITTDKDVGKFLILFTNLKSLRLPYV